LDKHQDHRNNQHHKYILTKNTYTRRNGSKKGACATLNTSKIYKTSFKKFTTPIFNQIQIHISMQWVPNLGRQLKSYIHKTLNIISAVFSAAWVLKLTVNKIYVIVNVKVNTGNTFSIFKNIFNLMITLQKVKIFSY
jgi:hypothetical protein